MRQSLHLGESIDASSADSIATLRASYDELGSLLRLDPRSGDIWIRYLMAAAILEDLESAVGTVLDCVSLVPEPEPVFLTIARILHYNGHVSLASDIYKEILKCDPYAKQTHSELLIHKFIHDFSDEEAFQESNRWNDMFIRPLVDIGPPAETDKDPDRRLRIGFVSIDFGSDHSLNRAMAPWFTYRNPIAHEYICYSNGPATDRVHPVFWENSDEFSNVSNLSDRELSDRIRADRIDILVDMTGHMDGNRLVSYAPKPAPIIVSWVGIGLATGVEVIDYFLADEYRVPSDTTDKYREKVVHLPDTGMPWSAPKSAPDIAPPPMLGKGTVAFGNLSRLVKFQPATIALWAEVLKAVPNSTFTFKNVKMAGKNISRLEAAFESDGVSKDRLNFLPWSDQVIHLEAYNDIDIVLDSFPEQGGISSLEASWMGVPVISYEFSKYRCHVGLWLSSLLGLSDLVAVEKQQFVEIARKLAGRPDLLVGLRKGLRAKLAKSAICDGAIFMRGVERAFSEMWCRYCADLPPIGFSVPKD